MKTPSTSSSAVLRERLLDLLWRQWSALGVAGHARSQGNAIVDPEALVLVSTEFARFDARLFDEMLDWLRAYGTWINVQRLVRMQADLGLATPSVLAAIAEHLGRDSAHHKWKVLVKSGAPDAVAQPLFPHLSVSKSTDSDFQRWGWLRPPIEEREMSQLAPTHQPATFLLQLRALFGRQSRAEVIAWLLSNESGHPAQLARATGYMRASIQIVLNELEISGHVKVVRHGREKTFAALRDHWRFLLTWKPSGGFPRWLPWPSLFALVRGVHDLLAKPEFETFSPGVRAIEVIRVTGPIASRLAQEGWPMTFMPKTGATAEQWVAELVRLLDEFES